MPVARARPYAARMAEILRDAQTVSRDGQLLAPVPEGVRFRTATTHVDDRGSLCEMFDPRWGWHPGPLCYAYFVTVRPRVVKGWARHHLHEDRYFVIHGDLEVVLYDDREDSPTRGLLSRVYLSGLERRLMSIPTGVWHADHNVGTEDVLLVNFPDRPYDHETPDKERLPLVNDLIPHRFPPGAYGG
jgi:dTDP-4-dehydrorhamnose 3,5-epimerase